MSSYREIVTKAIISKGKKQFTHNKTIKTNNKPSTILGCWVINHKFNGVKQSNKILINGSYDINIWYSFDNDTKTDVIKETYTYNEIVNMKDDNHEYDNSSIIVRSLTDPKCNKAIINEDTIDYQVILELGIELVGDTKIKIAVDDELDEYNLIDEDNDTEKEIDNVNTDYLKE